MSKLTGLKTLLLCFILGSRLAYGVGINPDDTWYSVTIYAELTDSTSSTRMVGFTNYGEAEAAMRSAIKYGDKMVLEYANPTNNGTSYRFKFNTEDVIPGEKWSYTSGVGGKFPDSQGAIDAFFSKNSYDCIEENGPLGGWGEGSVWYCYPPRQPNTVEIATYNLQICQSRDIDPVICRTRANHCPEHTPRYVPSYRNHNPDLHNGGEYCYNGGYAIISEYKCDCDETGETGSCKPVDTEGRNYIDDNGTFHSTTIAVDPKYNPLSCPEKIEIPERCDKDAFKGNPINITNGIKKYTEIDYIGDGDNPLKIVRNYNTFPITAGLDLPKPFEEMKYTRSSRVQLCSGEDYAESTEAGSRLLFGNKWNISRPTSCPIMIVYKPNGEKIVYMLMVNQPAEAGRWYASNNPEDGRIRSYAGYNTYIDGAGKEYEFSSGNLLYIRQGKSLSRLEYTGGLLTSFTNPSGKSLNYFYDDQGRTTAIETPSGDFYKYVYDAHDNIVEAIFPDNTPADDSDNPRKRYLFEDPRFPNALTGIIDESEKRYATWRYDEYGRAISSEHGNGIDKTEIEYVDGHSTIVKEYRDDLQYKETLFQFARVGGRNRITSETVSPCENCDVGNIQKSYDPATGNLLQEVDENGNITTYEYDQENREIKRTRALGTVEEYIVETVWDDTFNKPRLVIRPDSTTEYTYDDSGRVLTKSERPMP